MDQFLYKLNLPAVEAHDVVMRELCVSINGGEVVVYEIADVNLGVYELTFEQDQQVSIYIVDVDDAGNRSANGEALTFHVIDTVPPAAPKAPIIIDVIEIAPAPVVVEPVIEDVVEDVVAEEPVVVEEPATEEVVEPVIEDVVEDVVAEEPVVVEDVVTEEVIEPVVEDETL